MTTTLSLTTSARALGVLALMTAATAIAAVPAAPQCSVPQAWVLPTATTMVGNGAQASCTASALATAVA